MNKQWITTICYGCVVFFKNEQSSSLYNTGLLKQFVKINVFSDKAFGFIEHGLHALPTRMRKNNSKRSRVASAKAFSLYSFWLFT